ncbi:hypothetical protein TRSC58_04032 [Trypanosoma rangeli SC58]|uniref:Exonuclease domain-containing protein n=1 Tax=Trypanosoma rangeli SC58 TaxID=429131 RepID=A0A061IYN8_TRYRA|nr:hypothetical protein TRSC58_04032 [Trypanosoma rangeli SC58]
MPLGKRKADRHSYGQQRGGGGKSCSTAMRRSFFRRARTAKPAQSLTHLEIFTQLQLGIHPPLSAQRQFIQQHFEEEMDRRGITEAKLLAMEGRLCTRLLRQLLFERYLSVPFRLFTFDLEFSGPPVFGPDGPTEDIIEFGFYSPANDATFSFLVKPTSGRRVSTEVSALTGITPAMLEEQGLSFPVAWEQVIKVLMMPEPQELPGAEKRLLVLSHGGKLADVSLIKWTRRRRTGSGRSPPGFLAVGLGVPTFFPTV